jgi:hypothetical protein
VQCLVAHLHLASVHAVWFLIWLHGGGGGAGGGGGTGRGNGGGGCGGKVADWTVTLSMQSRPLLSQPAVLRISLNGVHAGDDDVNAASL